MTKPNNPSGGHKGKPEHKVLVSGSIQAYPPPEVEKKHNAERQEDAAAHEAERQIDLGRESHKVWLERFTLLAVIIYAGITFWQGRLTRESIDNNASQFQIDQRPYIWTTEVGPKMTIEAGQRMWANMQIANFGKSPALKTKVAGKIFIGPTASQDADNWFDAVGNRPLTDPTDNGIVVPPGIPTFYPQVADSTKDAAKTKDAAYVPNGGFAGVYFTILSDNALTQPDVDYILHTGGSAIFVMRMEYADGFGKSYWTIVCLSRFDNGAIPHCARHNEMH